MVSLFKFPHARLPSVAVSCGGQSTTAHMWNVPCRVGTGLSDAEREQVEKRLRPFMIDAKFTKGKSNAPSCYKVTNKPKERPDVWITDPMRSLVVEVGLQ